MARKRRICLKQDALVASAAGARATAYILATAPSGRLVGGY